MKLTALMSPLWKIRVRSATVPRNAVGICHAMTRRTSRYAPPISRQSAETSPMHPPHFPRKRSSTEPSKAPVFSEASGVAEATASLPSIHANAGTNFVIFAVHASMRNTLAASAGFITFLPIPPKICLTTTIANTEPTIGT